MNRDLPKRYEQRRLWYDGPYSGSIAFDKVMERSVTLCIAYKYSDIPAFIRHAKVRASVIPTFCRCSTSV